ESGQRDAGVATIEIDFHPCLPLTTTLRFERTTVHVSTGIGVERRRVTDVGAHARQHLIHQRPRPSDGAVAVVLARPETMVRGVDRGIVVAQAKDRVPPLT